MLDRQGRVTSRFFEDYYWERNTVSNVLLRLGAAGTPVQATQVSTDHLDLQHVSQRRDRRPRDAILARARHHAQAGHARLRARRVQLSGHLAEHHAAAARPHDAAAVPGVRDLSLRAAERASAGVPETVHAADGRGAGRDGRSAEGVRRQERARRSPARWSTRPATTRSATTRCRFRSRGGSRSRGMFPVLRSRRKSDHGGPVDGGSACGGTRPTHAM